MVSLGLGVGTIGADNLRGGDGGSRRSGGDNDDDLDGNGIQIAELPNSSIYLDATDDGLENRTARAGTGDGVLCYGTGNASEITEMRQYVSTEWDRRRRWPRVLISMALTQNDFISLMIIGHDVIFGCGVEHLGGLSALQ